MRAMHRVVLLALLVVLVFGLTVDAISRVGQHQSGANSGNAYKGHRRRKRQRKHKKNSLHDTNPTVKGSPSVSAPSHAKPKNVMESLIQIKEDLMQDQQHGNHQSSQQKQNQKQDRTVQRTSMQIGQASSSGMSTFSQNKATGQLQIPQYSPSLTSATSSSKLQLSHDYLQDLKIPDLPEIENKPKKPTTEMLMESLRQSNGQAMDILDSMPSSLSVSEQLNRLAGRAPPPLQVSNGLPRFQQGSTDNLANDANDIVQELEQELQKEDSKKYGDDEDMPRMKQRKDRAATSTTKSKKSSKKIDEEMKMLQEKMKDIAGRMKKTQESEAEISEEPTEGKKKDAGTHRHHHHHPRRFASLFPGQTSLSVVEPVEPGASMRLLGVDTSDQKEVTKLGQIEQVDEQLVQTMLQRSEGSLGRINKVLAHVEDHQAHLNHVHQHLRNEIALLELKKRQLDEESKQEEEEADDVREDDEVNDNEDASATAEHPSLIELESKLPSPQPKPPSRIPFVHPHTQFGDIDDLEDFRGR